MAQERALTCPASLDFHRHWSWANLLAELMNVHRLCGESQEGDYILSGCPINHLRDWLNLILQFQHFFCSVLQKEIPSAHSTHQRRQENRLINQQDH